MEEELELVSPEFHQQVRQYVAEEENNNLQTRSVREKSPAYGEARVSHCVVLRRPEFMNLVFVTFYSPFEKKVVTMYLGGETPLEAITQKTAELFPYGKWRICSGNQHKSDYEFTNSRQVQEAIKRSPICRFNYLLVRLERIQTISYHECNNCHQMIMGHRYKCTECADFDICQSCEAKSLHSEHAMLRIVGRATRIPGYITRNAPVFVRFDSSS
uniref:ZZ-type domain-containing protein n=1 Tax=Caenorhabditis tropicalis TaxID=1561998 RepID=A0A1I7UDZ0_9PELO